ncbi:MAG: hypothetical protein ACE5E0_06700 [Terriglobia bacterium]
MSVKPNDLIDEKKKHDQSCRVLVKVVSGGAGFESISCCGNELTAEDTVEAAQDTARSTGSQAGPGLVIDESKNHPESCGLKIEVLDGGAGLEVISCCGNKLTADKDSV